MSTGTRGAVGVTPGQAFVTDPGISALAKYRLLVIGPGRGWLALARYELLLCLFGPMPGAAGHFFRRTGYRPLFRRCGRGVTVGRDVVLRHPGNVSLGDNVYLDDHVVLDARDGEIVIGDGTFVGRGASVKTKGGRVRIGASCNIGAGALLGTRSSLVLEDFVLVAANCNIGAGNHRHDRLDVPIIAQGMEESRETLLGRGAWLGTGVVLLDGAGVGADAIVGALSLVTREIPALAVAAGQPAKVLRYRDGRE